MGTMKKNVWVQKRCAFIRIFPCWDGEMQETSLFKNLGILKLQDGGPASYTVHGLIVITPINIAL